MHQQMGARYARRHTGVGNWFIGQDGVKVGAIKDARRGEEEGGRGEGQRMESAEASKMERRRAL